ncbi:MAG: ABC transporter ATP-binding protein [Puniceicoccaceae bacterium]
MKKFWPYIVSLKDGKRFYVWGILFGILFAIASGAGIPGMMRWVLPRVFADGETMELGRLLLTVFGIPIIFILRGVSGYLNVYFINKGGVMILEEIRCRYYQKLLEVEVAYFNNRGLGDLVSRLTADATIIQQTFTENAVDVVKQPLQLLAAVGFLIYMSFMDVRFSMMLGSLFVIPICVLPVQKLGKKLFNKVKKQQEELGDLSQMVSDAVLGSREIRIFRAEGRFFDHFMGRIREFMRTQLRVVAYYHALSPTIEVITVFGVSIAFVAAYFLDISQSDLFTMIAALYLCYEPVKKIGVLSSRFQRGRGALERLEEVMNHEVAVREAEHPVELEKVEGSIAFENVNFSYGQEPTLQEVSFCIQPGEKVAVVGPSGAGKSTLIQLLPRFYDPDSGSICLDRHDVKSISLQSLRKHIAVVLQEPVLFSGTFLENLKLGNPEASMEQVETAAKKAYIHDFILSLPEGYQTQTGQRGLNLSGGQKQRIALARAFLKHAPILIMDEATSALDSESEEKIQMALENLFDGVTALIIAHRFSSIRFVDRILVLDKGRLLAQGTHAELMDSCELYRKLYTNQVGV